MSGLKRIILIDTHLPGLVELKVDGHTNICGTNASGKTTLQRLIPVFYGESPNKVVPATRDNFQTWYLPRQSSYIIFEYQRIDKTLCMAVLTSSNTSVVYRFIEKQFVVNDFIGEDMGGSRSFAISEVIRNLRQDAVVTSKSLNNKEFRAVIQNDKPVMALSANKRDLLTAARYFSLCESDARLRHIEKLIKAVHSKEGKMETIKAMISAILEEDGVETPSNKISKAQVEDWIKECQLIKEFDGLMPQYNKLQKVNATLANTEHRLSQLKHHLSDDFKKLSESIVNAQQNQHAYKSQLADITQKFDLQRDELHKKISIAKADINSSEQHLDQIETDFNHWQDKDIESHQANIEKLHSWQSQLQSVIEQHALLTEEHLDIEAAYHKRVAEIEKKQSKELGILNTQKDNARDELRAKQLAEHQALQSLQYDQEQRLSSVVDDFQRQINDSQLSLQTLKTTLDLSSATLPEQQAMSVLEANVEQTQIEEDHARNDLQAAQESLQQIKYHQMASNEKLNKARTKVKKSLAHLDDVNLWLHPGEHTFLEFLRKQHLGWEANIGKIINPELLSRTDLSPVLLAKVAAENAEPSGLYGVLIDTDVILESDVTHSESELKVQYSTAKQDVERANLVLQTCENELANFNQQVRELEQQCTALQSKCQFKQQARLRVQDERAQLKSEHKQLLIERKKKQQATLQFQQKVLNKLVANQETAKQEHKSQCHDEKMEHELHWQQLISDVEQKLSQLNEQINSASLQHQEGIKACKKWYKNELANRDVDVNQIGELKQTIAQIKDNIDVTNKHRDDVADYARWYDLVFTKQKAQHLNNLSKVKDSKAKTERLLSEKSSEYKQQKQQVEDQIQQLDKALKEQEILAAGISALKPQYACLHLPVTEQIVEQATAAARLVESRELLEQQRRASHDITEFVAYFDNAIGQKSGISLTETWERARRDCQIENTQGIMVLDSRKMVHELETLLTVLVPQHLAGVRNNGLNFGNDLTQYYNILTDIDKRISSQSRRITKEVDQELFLDGVSESSVKIRSRISEFDFWPKLKRFNQLHQAWLISSDTPLPDEEYTQTIREVLDVLGKATMSGGINQLLDIELHLKEGNSNLIIRTDRQLNESSSHGMAYLILCKFLLAFTRLLRGNSKAIVHWPIDEIGTLANKNVKKIFDACKANNITVLGAFPNPESDVLHFFENRYLIDKNAQQQKLRMVQPKVNAISERLKQRQLVEEQL